VVVADNIEIVLAVNPLLPISDSFICTPFGLLIIYLLIFLQLIYKYFYFILI